MGEKSDKTVAETSIALCISVVLAAGLATYARSRPAPIPDHERGIVYVCNKSKGQVPRLEIVVYDGGIPNGGMIVVSGDETISGPVWTSDVIAKALAYIYTAQDQQAASDTRATIPELVDELCSSTWYGAYLAEEIPSDEAHVSRAESIVFAAGALVYKYQRGDAEARLLNVRYPDLARKVQQTLQGQNRMSGETSRTVATVASIAAPVFLTDYLAGPVVAGVLVACVAAAVAYYGADANTNDAPSADEANAAPSADTIAISSANATETANTAQIAMSSLNTAFDELGSSFTGSGSGAFQKVKSTAAAVFKAITHKGKADIEVAVLQTEYPYLQGKKGARDAVVDPVTDEANVWSAYSAALKEQRNAESALDTAKTNADDARTELLNIATNDDVLAKITQITDQYNVAVETATRASEASVEKSIALQSLIASTPPRDRDPVLANAIALLTATQAVMKGEKAVTESERAVARIAVKLPAFRTSHIGVAYVFSVASKRLFEETETGTGSETETGTGQKSEAEMTFELAHKHALALASLVDDAEDVAQSKNKADLRTALGDVKMVYLRQRGAISAMRKAQESPLLVGGTRTAAVVALFAKMADLAEERRAGAMPCPWSNFDQPIDGLRAGEYGLTEIDGEGTTMYTKSGAIPDSNFGSISEILNLINTVEGKKLPSTYLTHDAETNELQLAFRDPTGQGTALPRLAYFRTSGHSPLDTLFQVSCGARTGSLSVNSVVAYYYPDTIDLNANAALSRTAASAYLAKLSASAYLAEPGLADTNAWIATAGYGAAIVKQMTAMYQLRFAEGQARAASVALKAKNADLMAITLLENAWATRIGNVKVAIAAANGAIETESDSPGPPREIVFPASSGGVDEKAITDAETALAQILLKTEVDSFSKACLGKMTGVVLKYNADQSVAAAWKAMEDANAKNTRGLAETIAQFRDPKRFYEERRLDLENALANLKADPGVKTAVEDHVTLTVDFESGLVMHKTNSPNVAAENYQGWVQLTDSKTKLDGLFTGLGPDVQVQLYAVINAATAMGKAKVAMYSPDELLESLCN
jgi:hypothetical protein